MTALFWLVENGIFLINIGYFETTTVIKHIGCSLAGCSEVQLITRGPCGSIFEWVLIEYPFIPGSILGGAQIS